LGREEESISDFGDKKKEERKKKPTVFELAVGGVAASH